MHMYLVDRIWNFKGIIWCAIPRFSFGVGIVRIREDGDV